MNFKIDNLQYCNWSRKIFEINREAGLDAVHVTIVYHEDFDEFQNVIRVWNKHFKENTDLIFLSPKRLFQIKAYISIKLIEFIFLIDIL
jgi:hypothetical protein